jgi:hypothetical protein
MAHTSLLQLRQAACKTNIQVVYMHTVDQEWYFHGFSEEEDSEVTKTK